VSSFKNSKLLKTVLSWEWEQMVEKMVKEQFFSMMLMKLPLL